jgi:hypothetical protein
MSGAPFVVSKDLRGQLESLMVSEAAIISELDKNVRAYFDWWGFV